jgi:ABC-type hemin transport system ATPase subunit
MHIYLLDENIYKLELKFQINKLRKLRKLRKEASALKFIFMALELSDYYYKTYVNKKFI